MENITIAGTATAFPLRLRLHYKTARAAGVRCTDSAKLKLRGELRYMNKKDRIAIVLSIVYGLFPLFVLIDGDAGAAFVFFIPIVLYWGYRFIQGNISFIGKKMVNHSKCKKCGEISNVLDLKDNPDGAGKICIDEVECKKRQQKLRQGST